jgi:hypothetical protein
MTLDSQHDRDVPVPWAKLKEVTDAHGPPRLELDRLLGLLVGILTIGLSVVAFSAAFVTALDSTETVEPATGMVIACVGLGVAAALCGVSLLLGLGSSSRSHR